MVFDADMFAEMPDAPPNVNDAVTESALADVEGLVNAIRIINELPATYVQFPVRFVKLVMANAACALILMFNMLLGPKFNGRAEISSIPKTVALIESAWLAVPAAILIKKSIYPMPMIVFDAEAFAVTSATRPPNDAVTANAFALVIGLLDKGTRIVKVVPAMYVPLPDCIGAPVIVNAACALIAMIRLLVGGLNARPVISSDPVTVVVIVTIGWLTAFERIVTRK